jgi:hypothetical protein
LTEIFEDAGEHQRRQKELGDPWKAPVIADKCIRIGELVEDVRMSTLAFHAISIDGVDHKELVHYAAKSAKMGVIDLVVPGVRVYRQYHGKIFVRAWGQKIGA